MARCKVRNCKGSVKKNSLLQAAFKLTCMRDCRPVLLASLVVAFKAAGSLLAISDEDTSEARAREYVKGNDCKSWDRITSLEIPQCFIFRSMCSSRQKCFLQLQGKFSIFRLSLRYVGYPDSR